MLVLKYTLLEILRGAMAGIVPNQFWYLYLLQHLCHKQAKYYDQPSLTGVLKCKISCCVRSNPYWVVKLIWKHQLSGSSNVTCLSDPGGNKTTWLSTIGSWKRHHWEANASAKSYANCVSHDPWTIERLSRQPSILYRCNDVAPEICLVAKNFFFKNVWLLHFKYFFRVLIFFC